MPFGYVITLCVCGKRQRDVARLHALLAPKSLLNICTVSGFYRNEWAQRLATTSSDNLRCAGTYGASKAAVEKRKLRESSANKTKNPDDILQLDQLPGGGGGDFRLLSCRPGTKSLLFSGLGLQPTGA